MHLVEYFINYILQGCQTISYICLAHVWILMSKLLTYDYIYMNGTLEKANIISVFCNKDYLLLWNKHVTVIRLNYIKHLHCLNPVIELLYGSMTMQHKIILFDRNYTPSFICHKYRTRPWTIFHAMHIITFFMRRNYRTCAIYFIAKNLFRKRQ